MGKEERFCISLLSNRCTRRFLYYLDTISFCPGSGTIYYWGDFFAKYIIPWLISHLPPHEDGSNTVIAYTSMALWNLKSCFIEAIYKPWWGILVKVAG